MKTMQNDPIREMFERPERGSAAVVALVAVTVLVGLGGAQRALVLGQGHAVAQQSFGELVLVETFDGCQLQAIVDATGFRRRTFDGQHGAAFGLRQTNQIGEIELTLGVVVFQQR